MRTKHWLIEVVFFVTVIAMGCSGSSITEKPVIGGVDEYNKVLAEATRLSDEAFKKMAVDEELTAKEKQSLTAAANQWQALVDYEPTKFAPFLALGMVYRGIGDLESAERNLRQCLSNIPKDGPAEIKETEAETRYQLSRVLLQQGKFDDALDEANRAVQAVNQNPNYFVARASAFNELRRTDEAVKDLQVALKLDPNHSRAKGLLKLLKKS